MPICVTARSAAASEYNPMKEAVPIDSNQKRRVSTQGARSSAGAPASGKGGPKKKTKKITVGGVLGGFFRFLACILCLCVMVGSVGAVVLAMYVAQVTEDDAEKLDLDMLSTAQTTIVYAKNGDVYVRWSSSDNRSVWVTLENIPQDLQNAFIAIEDKDFRTEPGVNFKRTILAALNSFTHNAILGSQQGASTIEQQFIKNQTGDDAVDPMRKVREIFRALGLARKYSKDTILEAYLNTVPLTGTNTGVQSAANDLFGKDVSELSLAECATLACITKNPNNYNPYTNPQNLIIRRDYCLGLMRNQGYITEAECDAARAEPLVLVDSSTDASNATVASNNSYFADACYEALIDALIYAGRCADRSEAVSMIRTGGLRVYSTVDPEKQAAMEQIMLNENDKYFPAVEIDQIIETGIPEGTNLQTDEETGLPLKPDGSAIFAVDAVPSYTDKEKTQLKTGTYKDSSGNSCIAYYERVRTQAAMAQLNYDGEVEALVGGVGQKQYDLGHNRATALRQTGSTMKPIGAYCLGIEYKAIHYSSMIPDLVLYTAEQQKVADENGRWRDWPRNYTGWGDGSLVPVYKALEQSLNTVAVRVGDMVDPVNIYEFVHDTLNCTGLVEADAALAPIVLGSQSYGISPVQLAGAYSIFYDGTFTTPHYFTIVEDYAGNPILDLSDFTTTAEAIEPETATIMNRLLRNVLFDSNGTARGMAPNTPSGHNAAAKTGTTSDYKDFTFCGMTPYSVTAVWWGFDKPTPMDNLGHTSGTPTQRAWKAYIEATESELPDADFPMADGVVARQFDPNTGLLVSSGGKTGYYYEDYQPGKVSDTADPYAGDDSYLNDALNAYQNAN